MRLFMCLSYSLMFALIGASKIIKVFICEDYLAKENV